MPNVVFPVDGDVGVAPRYLASCLISPLTPFLIGGRRILHDV